MIQVMNITTFKQKLQIEFMMVVNVIPMTHIVDFFLGKIGEHIVETILVMIMIEDFFIGLMEHIFNLWEIILQGHNIVHF
mgnify:CR=1 FL=1